MFQHHTSEFVGCGHVTFVTGSHTMRRRSAFVIIAIVIAIVGVFLVTLIQKQRAARDLVYSINNLRELGQFVELNPALTGQAVDPRWDAGNKGRFKPMSREKLLKLGLAPEVPAGTRGVSLPVESRLSWVSTLLPTFGQGRQPTAELAGRLNPAVPWDRPPNREVAATPIEILRVYSNRIQTPPGEPVPMQFVGLGGVGVGTPAEPRTPASGAFRYDEPTPFSLFTDGLSETGLFADVSSGLGPWLQGGPSTIRTYDPKRPAIGPGVQFGGNFPHGALVGYADHSVRFLSNNTDRAIVANLMTVAGGGGFDPIPGE